MSEKNPPNKMKPRSGLVTDGLERAPARGMLRAVGMQDEDFKKAQIGIASSWNEITPCNLSLDRLAKASKKGVFEEPIDGKGKIKAAQYFVYVTVADFAVDEDEVEESKMLWENQIEELKHTIGA